VAGVIVIVVVLLVIWYAVSGAKRTDPRNQTSVVAKPSASAAPLSQTLAAARKSAPRDQQTLIWHGGGSNLSLAGFTLIDPYVYVSASPRDRFYSPVDPSEIDPSAGVRRPMGPTAEMGYWPWYSRIQPEHRYLYLEWLASGKRTLPSQEGLLFLYFYGLERRLLVDGRDKELVLREVVRLRRLDESRRGTSAGRSFRGYSTALLWFEVARAPDLFDHKGFDKLCEFTDTWHEGVLSPPLAWLARRNLPLPLDLAMRVARLNPRSQHSVVTARVADHFKELFAKRYADRFGTGLHPRGSKRPVRYSYRPASNGFGEVSCMIADPLRVPSQFEPLADIWNTCVEDLRKLSKVTVPSGSALTPQAWAAMPQELREGIDHPLSNAVRQLIVDAASAGDARDDHECVLTAGRLAQLVGIESRPKLTPSQGRAIAETIEHAGYNVEPDARLTNRGYGWDEPVAIFLRTDSTPVDRQRYLGAACVLHMGLSIAAADGQVDAEELRCLGTQVATIFSPPAHEERRLEALRAVLARGEAELGSMARRIESTLAPTARPAVGRLLVAIAAATNGIDQSERAALRKSFRSLGLGPEALDQAIADILPESADGAMVVVQAGAQSPRGGESIPRQEGLRLNRESISAIMAETRDVAKLLADAIAEAEEPQAAGEGQLAPASEAVSTAVLDAPKVPTPAQSQPPARFAGFLSELSAQRCWPRAEAEELARRHGLMLAGAIESINEWAFDVHGASIIEEAEQSITIETELL
jgi:tellurite resistance protein